MTDILEFIEARLAADEQRAQAAGAGSPDWTAADSGGAHGVYGGTPHRPDPDDPELLEWDHTIAYPEGSPTEAEAQHIADNDPAAALRRCRLFRTLLERDSTVSEMNAMITGEWGNEAAFDIDLYRDIATYWDWHPEYQPEWAPAEEGEQQ